MDIYQIIGWVGTVLILGGYFLNQNNYLETDDWRYGALNLFGALAIGVDVYINQAWPAFGLQIAWVLISIVALYKYFLSKPQLFKFRHR
jgi:hypothetical protein